MKWNWFRSKKNIEMSIVDCLLLCADLSWFRWPSIITSSKIPRLQSINFNQTWFNHAVRSISATNISSKRKSLENCKGFGRGKGRSQIIQRCFFCFYCRGFGFLIFHFRLHDEMSNIENIFWNGFERKVLQVWSGHQDAWEYSFGEKRFFLNWSLIQTIRSR